MSIRSRILLGFVALLSIGLYQLFLWVVDDLEPQYRKSTEEPLVDASRLLAALASATMTNGVPDVTLFKRTLDLAKQQTFEAKIYDFMKSSVDLRVYITDRAGIVIFDSNNNGDLGKDYSNWRDVRLTMQGQYGSRTSHENPDAHSSVMYVAAPIVKDNQIIGVVAVGKPTESANLFVHQAKKRVVIGTLVTFLVLLVIGYALSKMVTVPIERLTQYARAIRDGKRAELPDLGKGEIRELGAAFEEMRETLEGKKYIERYVENMAHEMKSPLSAVQGALELIQEQPSEEQKNRFLQNIHIETKRMQSLVERMLLLSSIETRRQLKSPEPILVQELLLELKQDFEGRLQQKEIRFELSGDPALSLQGERTLVLHALANVLQNALEFSPRSSVIRAHWHKDGPSICIEVRDEGPGIPAYAQERIFDRFYSLQRPDTGKKSSGLGLSLVKEVMQLHAGAVRVETPSTGSGTSVKLLFLDEQPKKVSGL